MAAKRWSPLCVFAGGCLSGAALLGGYWGALELPTNSDSIEATAASGLSIGEVRSPEDPGCAENPKAEVALLPESGSSAPVAAPPGRTGETAAASPDAGSSVADVLARLEAEYRQGIAPAPATAFSSPAGGGESSLAGNQLLASANSREASATPNAALVPPVQQPAVQQPAVQQPAVQQPAAVQAAGAPEVPSVHAHSARPPAEGAPITARVAEEALARSGSASQRPDLAFHEQQQVAAHIQSVVAYEQIALIQQFALIQYLQFQAAPPRGVARRQRAQRPYPFGGRVAGPPSSGSNTDNPWGYDFPPTVLVR